MEAIPETTSIVLNWKAPKDAHKVMVRGYNIGWGINSADELVQYVTDHVTSFTIENLGGLLYELYSLIETSI